LGLEMIIKNQGGNKRGILVDRLTTEIFWQHPSFCRSLGYLQESEGLFFYKDFTPPEYSFFTIRFTCQDTYSLLIGSCYSSWDCGRTVKGLTSNLNLITGFRHLVPLWFLLCPEKIIKNQRGNLRGISE
jgi:hypothetical protein